MPRPLLGLTLQPERRYLELLDEAFHCDVDYLEITPETLWRRDEAQTWVPNGFRKHFEHLRTSTALPFVAHAVGASLGTADPLDRPRQKAWLERIARDAASFEFLWLSDHLGATMLGAAAVTLPVALPMCEAAATIVRERLIEMQSCVADVGFENSVFYYLHGPWSAEPQFFEQILRAPRTHLVLDLHNVYTMAQNFRADPYAYLEALPLDRVIEIHLSGGSESDPSWFQGRRTLRLDSHDNDVPEEVWQLYEHVLPRCRSVRGVTLERMEGTVDEAAVPRIRAELLRAREVLHARS